MSEYQYHKDQSIVTAMAWRIAEGGAQEFATLEAFVAVYGQRAAEMLAQGVLRSALWDIGVATAPASFGGEGRDQPLGLKLRPVGKVA